MPHRRSIHSWSKEDKAERRKAKLKEVAEMEISKKANVPTRVTREEAIAMPVRNVMKTGP